MDVSKYNFDDYEIARLQEYRDNQPDVRLKVRDGFAVLIIPNGVCLSPAGQVW